MSVTGGGWRVGGREGEHDRSGAICRGFQAIHPTLRDVYWYRFSLPNARIQNTLPHEETQATIGAFRQQHGDSQHFKRGEGTSLAVPHHGAVSLHLEKVARLYFRLKPDGGTGPRTHQEPRLGSVTLGPPM